jgi:hypothetical protein
MMGRVCIALLSFAFFGDAVIIDRVAIVNGNSVVKDSDIERDIRITDFLNGQPLSFAATARRAAANRLLDQAFIRREIRTGDYPVASMQDVDRQLSKLEQQRFRTHEAFESTLQRYGLTDLDLRTQFQWQLTVLTFVDQRFRPAAYVSDEEIQSYFSKHQAELKRQFPSKTSVDDLRSKINDQIAAEKTNQLFFAWLDGQRRETKIQYREQDLK